MNEVRVVEGDALAASIVRLAEVIERSYPAGSVRMDAAFMRWALIDRDRTGPPPLGVLAGGHARAIGAAIAIPVELQGASTRFPAYLVTGVAVAPEARGQGLGRLLYNALLPAIHERLPDAAVLTFAQVDSVGARLIEDRYPAHQWHGRQLLAHPAWGALRKKLIAQQPLVPDGAHTVPRRDALRPADGTTTWLLGDPRCVPADVPSGRVAVLPLVGEPPRRLGALDLFATPVDPVELARSLHAAATALPDDVPQVTVSCLDEDSDLVATAVGLRRLPTPAWQPWAWATRPDHPALSARRTTMPVT